jgi:7-carboxy-7-deazaguanine synthase
MFVNEKFLSIQGEGIDAGRTCAFLRFTACNVRCQYCDTAYAFDGGKREEIDELVDYVRHTGAQMVCLTGGEPMLQKDIIPLMNELLDAGFHVVIETNGIIPLDKVPDDVVKVVDIKSPGAFRTPQSPEDYATSDAFLGQHFHYPNLETLNAGDQIKFVVCDREDYEWAREFIGVHKLTSRVDNVLISPSHKELNPRDVVEWMTEDALPARLNLQLHKYIWGADAQGV